MVLRRVLGRGRATACAWYVVGLVGCVPFGGGGVAAKPFMAVPEAPSDQAKCKVGAQHDNPLVTEWPASEKANLEGLLREGTVVVSYSGCTMRLMPQCHAGGRYVWRRTTVSSDNIEIRDADELYAKLPIGAVSLEGELQRSGRLEVQTTVSGQMQLAEFDPNAFPTDMACLGATHVLGALSVGAFKLKSGGGADVRGNAAFTGIGAARGQSQREESLMREAGSPDKCELGTEAAPNVACASPVQVFLRPLPRLLADRGLPGMMKVRFLPVRGDMGWGVGSGERLLCDTPCEKWVDPAIPFNYRKEKEFVDLPDLREHSTMERVQIEVQPTNKPVKVLGIVGTSLFGITAASGTVFTSVGFASNDSGFKTAGLITLPIGLAGLAASIYAIVSSGSHVEVNSWNTAGDGLSPAGVR